jgi:hypothetical protein
LAGTETLPVVQGGITEQVSVANLTAGRAVSAASLSLTTTPLPATSGGTGLSSFTLNGIPYANTTTTLTTDSGLTFDGTNFVAGIFSVSSLSATIASAGIAGVKNVFDMSASGNGGAGRGTSFRLLAPGSSSAVAVARVVGYQTTNSATANNAALTIEVANSGGTLTEYLRINNAGNVGIGTSAPSAKLELSDATLPVYLQQTRGSVVQIAGPTGTAVTSPGQVGTSSTSPFRLITDNIERIRFDTAGNAQFQTGATMPYAPAPAGISAAATLTNANIQAQIISATGTTYTITMPLGTTLETLATWQGTGVAYDFFVINTATGAITMAVNTGVTSLGSLTISIGASAHFRIRRTAANTFVLYRLV